MEFKALLAGLAAACLSAPAALADDALDPAIALGKAAYAAHCAVCHGADAKGGGDFSQYLNVRPVDLTQLRKTAGGEFPFSEVYQLIDGRKMVRAHGEAGGMPIWGNYFTRDSLIDRGANTDTVAHIVQGRILSLVYYLQTIQN